MPARRASLSNLESEVLNDPRRCSAFPDCQTQASASANAGGRAGAEAGASVSAVEIAVDAPVFEGG
jgi:hypothetical protein